MTNNQKILLGVGAVALAYFLYKRNSNGANGQAPSNPNLEGDVDENYNKCLKEFESLAKPSFRHDPKQYRDDFIKDCMKRSSISNPCKYPNEVPCGNGSGKCYMINARYSQDPCKLEATPKPNMPRVKDDREIVYEFVKNYKSDPNRATNRMVSFDFKIGQKIKGLPDYYNCALGSGGCPIKTTTKGEFQSNQNSMYWITIPQGYLKVSN
jgi:hypothetical protein